MEFYCSGRMWMTLALFTLPLLDGTVSCPSSCQCSAYGYVSCTGSTVTDVPKILPLDTYTLNLSNTGMNIVTERSLAEQVFLVRFSLMNSHLHTIHPQAFKVAPQLKSVKLSFNDLSALPPRVFSPLTMLEEIYLDSNQLQMIAPDTFAGLVSLLVLDLNNNSLSSLPLNIFDELTNLTLLNLGRNQLKKLSPTIFHSLSKLRQLRIYVNKLEGLEDGIFDKLVSLEELTLFQNQIARLPPQVFWSLRNLKILSLSSNQLQGVPPRSFYNMPQLVKLTIYKNPLLSLPDELMGHMPYIKEFYLYGTNLVTVPGNLFTNMSGLLNLNFHLNQNLTRLPPDLFCCLPNLRKLSLRNNILDYFHPQLFSTLSTLNTLLLNDNNLTALHENIFQNLRQAKIIDLKNNHFKTLPGDIFTLNPALRNLYLSGNPWDCTCAIKGIATWIRQNERVVHDRDDVMCHSPIHQMLRTLGSLRHEEFDYCDKNRQNISFPTEASFSEETQPSTVGPVTPPATPTTSETTTCSTSLPTTTATQPNKVHSTTFYNKLVVQQGPEYIHHRHHNGWVSVWFLPSNKAVVGFLMVCYFCLLVTGLLLILAATYVMHRLSTTMDKLKLERVRNDE